MPSIIISKNSQFVSVYPVGSKTRIGRSPKNDIVLDAAGISRVHTRIEQQQDRFVLVDDSSTNGTYIKDQRIRRHLLSHGTSFRILDYLLTYVEDIHPPDAAPDGVITSTLTNKTSQNMLETLWLTQHATPEKGVRQKVLRLLKMVTDLAGGPADVDAGNLVLEALLDMTGAKRGIVAMKQKQAAPIFSHIKGFDRQTQSTEVSRTILQKVLDSGTSQLYRSADREKPTTSICKLDMKSVLCVPLICGGDTMGCVYLDHPDVAGVFSESDQDLVAAAADYIANTVLQDSSRSGDVDPVAGELMRAGIVARSPKTVKVFKDSQTIARYHVSVLIFGETGTGKEVIARYIHDQSGRRGRFIGRNCSAISASMFESELFGHEKGAFTGAIEQKRGMLELADQGTLFLDEIGDMPVDLQAKMLRALQEQEIWRVGGSAPVKIDIRVIAATHKDIKKKRKELNFRDDLYYRLANVEITAPSLRERPEDIAPLGKMILEIFSKEHQDLKKQRSLSPKAVRLLEAYDWPGNIRELRNTLIQASLRCDSAMLEPRHLKGLIDVFAAPTTQGNKPLPPLVEVERVHIIKALQCTNGNKSAAAKILAIDRNRLNRRLKKLGIDTLKSK
jgi:transcriptional regulator with GAF, ATPase, and Fis domain